MKQTCPYLEQCKVPKETHRCFDDLKYVQCTIYKRYQNMGDVKNDDLAPEVESMGISKLLKMIDDLGPDWYKNYLRGR